MIYPHLQAMSDHFALNLYAFLVYRLISVLDFMLISVLQPTKLVKSFSKALISIAYEHPKTRTVSTVSDLAHTTIDASIIWDWGSRIFTDIFFL